MTPTDDTQQLGELPIDLVRPAIVTALKSFARDEAFDRWILNRETAAQALTVCQKDALPTLGVPELEEYLPFLAF